MEEIPLNQQQDMHDTTSVTPKKQTNIWVIISIILLIILVGVGAYAFGKNQIPSSRTPIVSQPKITQPSTSPTVGQPSPTTSTSAVSPITSKKVSAGIKNQFFSPYTVLVPSGWTDTHTASAGSDLVTLSKGGYTLTISQAAGGAGSCMYPSETPVPMAQVFTSFVGITGVSSQFRRGSNTSGSYTICEQTANGFSFPTSFGYITYSTPTPSDLNILSVMDGMVASLTK